MWQCKSNPTMCLALCRSSGTRSRGYEGWRRTLTSRYVSVSSSHRIKRVALSAFTFTALPSSSCIFRRDRLPGRLDPHVGVEPRAARAERAAARRLRQGEPRALHLSGQQVRRVRRRRQRRAVAGRQRLAALLRKCNSQGGRGLIQERFWPRYFPSIRMKGNESIGHLRRRVRMQTHQLRSLPEMEFPDLVLSQYLTLPQRTLTYGTPARNGHQLKFWLWPTGSTGAGQIGRPRQQ